MAPSPVDPTVPVQYPVDVSNGLLGKKDKQTYTGLHLNHRPTLTSPSAPDNARIKATDGTFDYSFVDNGRYNYTGSREEHSPRDDKQKLVLIYNPDSRSFSLHALESTFSMNLTRTPDNTNAESLRQQFDQLETTVPPPPVKKPAASGPVAARKPAAANAKAAKPAAAAVKKTKPAPANKKAKPASAEHKTKHPALNPIPSSTTPLPLQLPGSLSLPVAQPATELSLPPATPTPASTAAPTPARKEKKKKKAPSVYDLEADEDEEDGVDPLRVVYTAPTKKAGVTTMRRFSEVFNGGSDHEDYYDSFQPPQHGRAKSKGDAEMTDHGRRDRHANADAAVPSVEPTSSPAQLPSQAEVPGQDDEAENELDADELERELERQLASRDPDIVDGNDVDLEALLDEELAADNQSESDVSEEL